jgi:hypothetical protein
MDSDNNIQICISRQTYSNAGYFVWVKQKCEVRWLVIRCVVQQWCEALLNHFHWKFRCQLLEIKLTKWPRLAHLPHWLCMSLYSSNTCAGNVPKFVKLHSLQLEPHTVQAAAVCQYVSTTAEGRITLEYYHHVWCSDWLLAASSGDRIPVGERFYILAHGPTQPPAQRVLGRSRG